MSRDDERRDEALPSTVDGAAGAEVADPGAAEPPADAEPAADAEPGANAAEPPVDAEPADDAAEAVPDAGPGADAEVAADTTGVDAEVVAHTAGRDDGEESTAPGAAAPEPAAPEPATAAPAARRLSAAGAVIGLLVGLLGFALVVQLRSTGSDTQLSSARPEDLVRILSDLDARQDRLRSEIASLEETRRSLESGAQGREAALAQARRRADELGILAGTLPADGPGLQVRFEGGAEAVRASTVLDAVEELRGAGAEAMQISGAGSPAVRIVASSYFVDAAQGLVVDGQHLDAPFTLTVIGDPPTMQTALNIPGGVVDTARQHGGTVIPQEFAVVHVTAVRQPPQLKYAHPVS